MAKPGSIRLLQAHSIDGVSYSPVSATTEVGLTWAIQDGFIVVRDGYELAAIYQTFFSIKVMKREPDGPKGS